MTDGRPGCSSRACVQLAASYVDCFRADRAGFYAAATGSYGAYKIAYAIMESAVGTCVYVLGPKQEEIAL